MDKYTLLAETAFRLLPEGFAREFVEFPGSRNRLPSRGRPRRPSLPRNAKDLSYQSYRACQGPACITRQKRGSGGFGVQNPCCLNPCGRGAPIKA